MLNILGGVALSYLAGSGTVTGGFGEGGNHPDSAPAGTLVPPAGASQARGGMATHQ
jgi:hypothetical protein